jgi:hypothetical protein
MIYILKDIQIIFLSQKVSLSTSQRIMKTTLNDGLLDRCSLVDIKTTWSLWEVTFKASPALSKRTRRTNILQGLK